MKADLLICKKSERLFATYSQQNFQDYPEW